jgi:hypothetical protein
MGLFDGKGVPKPRNLFTETHEPEQPTPKPGQKIGPAPRKRDPNANRGRGWSQIAQSDDHWGQTARMWELRRRVADGEDFETVKRELWADQYRGEPDA